jgi:hypothetical protein
MADFLIYKKVWKEFIQGMNFDRISKNCKFRGIRYLGNPMKVKVKVKAVYVP